MLIVGFSSTLRVRQLTRFFQDAVSYEVDLTTRPATVRECVPGDSVLAGPVLLDHKFLDLVENKIRARATAAMRNTITRQKLWQAFGGWWENQIKTKYDGGILQDSVDRGRRRSAAGRGEGP